MARKVISSYTGEASEVYVSKIEGINEPRTFYKKGEAWRCRAQYGVHPRDGGERWIVLREGCPDSFLPMFGTKWEAEAVMNWCFENDGSVGVAIHWLNRGDATPYINLLTRIQQVAEESLGELHIPDQSVTETQFKQEYMNTWNQDPHPTLGYIPPLHD